MRLGGSIGVTAAAASSREAWLRGRCYRGKPFYRRHFEEGDPIALGVGAPMKLESISLVRGDLIG